MGALDRPGFAAIAELRPDLATNHCLGRELIALHVNEEIAMRTILLVAFAMLAVAARGLAAESP